jgi:hypothetical protein
VENIVSGTLSSTGNPIDVTVDLSSADVSLRFTAAVVGKDESGNPDTTLNSAVANQILNPPSGSLPDGITTISRIYWQILTTLESYTADITFDLARVSGIVNPSNLRILKRLNSSDAWTVVSSYALVDASHLKATGITSFSEWAIGSTADNPLPVTLQSFGASVSGRVVHLQWETASDMNFFGFDVEKKEMNGSGTGNWTVAGFVPGTGSSNAPTRYEFSDACRAPGTYTYRIKMIDKDGTFFYSSESEVHIELLPAAYLLKQNFPNPFNPATTIQFSVALDARATLKIFNTIGKEMTVLFNGAAQAGTVYSFVWNGRMFPSDTYFAVLETGAKKEMIKLSLVK